jgi:hypothetical protein
MSEVKKEGEFTLKGKKKTTPKKLVKKNEVTKARCYKSGYTKRKTRRCRSNTRDR